MKKLHFGLISGIILVLFAFGCGGTRQLSVQGQNRAAGADGNINVERQDTGNFVVETEVEHLLPPSRFGDGLTTYAVWFQASDQQPQRVGVLDYDEGDRSGAMMATTSLTAFDVIVTGESAADAVAPSENVVFRTTVEAP